MKTSCFSFLLVWIYVLKKLGFLFYKSPKFYKLLRVRNSIQYPVLQHIYNAIQKLHVTWTQETSAGCFQTFFTLDTSWIVKGGSSIKITPDIYFCWTLYFVLYILVLALVPDHVTPLPLKRNLKISAFHESYHLSSPQQDRYSKIQITELYLTWKLTFTTSWVIKKSLEARMSQYQVANEHENNLDILRWCH